MLLLAFAPRLFPKVRDAAVTGSSASSIGWGFGLFFLLPIGSVLLLVTVVGIPLGVFTLLALAFLYTLGYVVATIGLGSRVLSSTQSRYVAFLGGWVILRLLALIPFVGGWLWFLGSVWGLGIAGRRDPSRPHRSAGGSAAADAARARRRGLALRAAPGDRRPAGRRTRCDRPVTNARP